MVQLDEATFYPASLNLATYAKAGQPMAMSHWRPTGKYVAVLGAISVEGGMDHFTYQEGAFTQTTYI